MEVPDPMKKMGFDRSIVVFSPEGRMYQVEYARKAVEKATTTIGLLFNEGVVLAATKAVQKLMIADSVEKIARVDDHIGVASCGILGDSRVLIDYARVRAQINRITYSEPIEISALVKDISDRKQRLTQVGGLRPFGVSLLIAGSDGGPHLYETDPSGSYREWKAHAIGRGSKDAKKFLIDEYKDSVPKDKAIELALKALKTGEKKLNSKAVEIGLVENNKFMMMSKPEVRDIVKKFA